MTQRVVYMQARGGQLSKHGKHLVIQSMYHKGKAFLAASVLLHQHGSNEYVVLHLLCQSIEIVLKAILLAINYDAYKPRLKKLGHDLLRIADEACYASKTASLSTNIRSELAGLNHLYKGHYLRYGSGHDILTNPHHIPSQLVLQRMAALLRLLERHHFDSPHTLNLAQT